MHWFRTALLSAAVSLAGPGSAGDTPAPLAVGDRVPDFAVSDLLGKSRTLRDLQKQSPTGAVVLTFWCSFCHSCRHLEGRLDAMAKRYAKTATVAALDASAGETAARVAAFAKKRGLSLPIFLDTPGETADLFGAKVTTTTVVIDREGTLRYRGQFARHGEAYAEEALKAVLAGKTVRRKETLPHG